MKTRIVSVSFGTPKLYDFKTQLPLKEGKFYKIETEDKVYGCPVYIMGTPKSPSNIPLKLIIRAQEVEVE